MRIFVITFLAFTILIFWPGQVSTASAWEYKDCGGFKSYGERVEFDRLLKKHGLHKRFSIIYNYPRDPYFEDLEGRRCAFK